MTIQEIKQAVDSGLKVYHETLAYPVIRDNLGQYLITCTLSDGCWGLTNLGGYRLNGNENEFFIR